MKAYSMDDISASQKPTNWIWRNYIPEANVTTLAAKGGVGKSGFALWLAGEMVKQEYKTLYVDYESTTKHMATRWKEWGYREKGFGEYILVPAKRNKDSNELNSDAPTFIEINDLVIKHDIKLIIIDSLTSFFAEYDMKERGAASKLFNELQSLAVQRSCAILLLAHVNKDIDPTPGADFNIDSISGSSAIKDLSRSVLGMLFDADKDEGRIIQHCKHNFSPKQPDIHFDLTSTGITNVTFNEKKLSRINQPIRMDTKMGQCKHIIIKALEEDSTLNKKQLRKLVIDSSVGNADYATKAYKELIIEGVIIK